MKPCPRRAGRRLGIGAARSFEIRCALERGDLSAKPGWVRICFSPASSEEDFQVLLDAVEALSLRWEEWAPEHRMIAGTDFWRHVRDDEALKNRSRNLRPSTLEGVA